MSGLQVARSETVPKARFQPARGWLWSAPFLWAMLHMLGRGVGCHLLELLMKLTAPAACPGGDPFASAFERMLWEAGYPTHYDTVEEAQAAVEELRRMPEFSGFAFEVKF